MAGKLGKTMMRAGVGKGGARKLACGGKKYANGGNLKKSAAIKKK
jgi:hypothetical protein